MANAEPARTSRCPNCHAEVARLYRVPEQHRVGPRPLEVLCHFCFLRTVKRRPRSAELVTVGGGLG